ncbi:31 kDa ribonucleoprotein, chloroplastic, partial [Linum grandiflorum]
ILIFARLPPLSIYKTLLNLENTVFKRVSFFLMASLLRFSCSLAPSVSAEHTVPYLQCYFPYRQTLSVTQLPTHSRSISIRTVALTRLSPLFSTTATQDPITAADSSSEQKQNEEFSNTRVMATNIPWTATAEDMRALFEKFGKVVDVELSMYGKNTNRGMVFVSMGSPEEARAAFENLQSYEYEGRVLTMNYAKLKKKKAAPIFLKMAPTFSLFVSNLPFEAKEKDLKELFMAGGSNVVYTEIIYHANPRKSSGYGFVAFKTKKEAEAALSAFQDKELMGRPLRVARSKQFVRPPRSQVSVADAATETDTSVAEEEAVDTTDKTT